LRERSRTAALRRRGRHEAGLVTFAPTTLEWEEEVRLAIEERTR